MKPKKITKQARHAQRVRAERLSLGICIQCGRLPASYRCATCRAQAAAATAARRAKSRSQA